MLQGGKLRNEEGCQFVGRCGERKEQVGRVGGHLKGIAEQVKVRSRCKGVACKSKN